MQEFQDVTALLKKKELLKLVFKRITIDAGKICLELYEPFKNIEEDYLIKWQLSQEQIVTRKRSQPCILELSAGRWLRYRGTMEKIAEALLGNE